MAFVLIFLTSATVFAIPRYVEHEGAKEPVRMIDGMTYEQYKTLLSTKKSLNYMSIMACNHSYVYDWRGFQENCYNNSGNKHVLLVRYKQCSKCHDMDPTGEVKVTSCPSKPKCVMN